MFTYLSRRGTRPRTTTRLRRITAALAALTGGLLAWAAAVPAASAATSLIPVPGGAYGPVPATAPAVPVQVIAAGGMPAGRSPSSPWLPPWSRPPQRCSWTGRGPAAGPPPLPDNTPAASA